MTDPGTMSTVCDYEWIQIQKRMWKTIKPSLATSLSIPLSPGAELTLQMSYHSVNTTHSLQSHPILLRARPLGRSERFDNILIVPTLFLLIQIRSCYYFSLKGKLRPNLRGAKPLEASDTEVTCQFETTFVVFYFSHDGLSPWLSMSYLFFIHLYPGWGNFVARFFPPQLHNWLCLFRQA